MPQVDYAALAQQHGGAAVSAPSIGAAMPGTAMPDIRGENNADLNTVVTLDDLTSNPRESMRRIGVVLKREASDPRNWLALAASYFGPKMAVQISPLLSRAAVSARAGVGAVATPGMAKDLATVGLGEGRVSAGIRIGERVADAVRNARGAASPVAVPPAEPVASTPVAQAPPTVQSAPETGPAPTLESAPTFPKNAFPDQRALNEEALARRRAEYQARTAPPAAPAKIRLSAPESKEYTRLVRTGKSSREALELIQTQRELADRLGLSTPTYAETTFPKGMRGKVPEE